MENDLEIVEQNIENVMETELQEENLDIQAIKNLNETICSLKEQGEVIKAQINQYKVKIQDRLNKDLSEFRFFTNFAYHFLIGIIIVGLLFIEFIGAILFFIFAWFRTIIKNRTESHIIFTDLEIYEISDFDKSKFKKVVLALTVIIEIGRASCRERV